MALQRTVLIKIQWSWILEGDSVRKYHTLVISDSQLRRISSRDKDKANMSRLSVDRALDKPRLARWHWPSTIKRGLEYCDASSWAEGIFADQYPVSPTNGCNYIFTLHHINYYLVPTWNIRTGLNRTDLYHNIFIFNLTRQNQKYT